VSCRKRSEVPPASRRSEGSKATEGWWEPVTGGASPRLHGKVEWERGDDGETEIDLLVRDLDLPDGETVEVVCDGTAVIAGVVSAGAVRAMVKSRNGERVAPIGDKSVELRHRWDTLATTRLDPD
jgi:hypothetical protein